MAGNTHNMPENNHDIRTHLFRPLMADEDDMALFWRNGREGGGGYLYENGPSTNIFVFVAN